jgi:hypothetical protein
MFTRLQYRALATPGIKSKNINPNNSLMKNKSDTPQR